MGDNLKPVDLGTGRTAVALSLGGTHTCAGDWLMGGFLRGGGGGRVRVTRGRVGRAGSYCLRKDSSFFAGRFFFLRKEFLDFVSRGNEFIPPAP